MSKLVQITGKAISGEWGTEDLDNNGILVLRTTNFTNEGKINYKNIIKRNIKNKNLDEKYLRKGDIIIEKSGGSDNQPVGRVVYFDGEEEKYLFNNFTGVLRVKSPNLWFAKYVFYSLFANYKKGGTRNFENKTTGLHNLKTDLYINCIDIQDIDFNKQKQIANILDKVTDLIDKHKKQLQKLDEIVKARFVEMFGDPVNNSKKWKMEKITAVCEKIVGGGTPSKSHPEYYTGNIPWVSPKDMKTAVISDSIDHITDEAIINSTTKLIPINSVLMVIRSGILKHTLPVAINTVSLTINQDMKAFIPNNRITHIFLLYYLKAIEADILSCVRGVTADNIDFKDFQLRKIIIPPIELQNKFADFVKQVEKTKIQVQKSLEQTETLKKSLMQKYFG